MDDDDVDDADDDDDVDDVVDVGGVFFRWDLIGYFISHKRI